jgi:hypothetical protein
LGAAVIAGILAGALGANAVLRQPKRYASRAILQIDQPNLIAAAGSEGPIAKLNQLRTKYALLADTARVTNGVAQKTGFPQGAIAGAVNVVLPGPSLLLVVEARTNDAGRSRTVADATAEELVTLVRSEMEAAKVPEASRIIMTVVAPAQPGIQFEPSRSRAVTVGTLAGILSLVGLIVIAETTRALRRRR